MPLSVSPDHDSGIGVHLKLFFSRHRTASDFARLEDLLSGADDHGKADVYCPELFGWNQEYVQQAQQVSSGSLAPTELWTENNPGQLHVFRLIHNSRKRIVMVDIPYDHPFAIEYRENYYNKSGAKELFINGMFDRSLELFRLGCEEFAQKEAERERYIEMQFGSLMNIAREQRRKIVALASLGIGHLDMDINLGDNFEVTRIFDLPYAASTQSKLIRHLVRGETCDDILFAQAQFELMFEEIFLSDFNDNAHKINVVSSCLIRQLRIEDFRSISRFLMIYSPGSPIYYDSGIDPFMVPFLRQELRELGLRIPSSPAEFEALYREFALLYI